MSDSIYEYDADRGILSKFKDGLDDIARTFAMRSIWASLALRDFRHATRRTKLGTAWSVLSTGLTVAVLGYVYGRVGAMPPSEAYPYIAGGLIIWFFISACVNGGLSVYHSARGLIEELALPVSFSVFRYTTKCFIEFLVKMLVFVVVAIIVQVPVRPETLLIIPGLLIMASTGMACVLFFGPVGARFRDINELASPIMLIAFLSSPVLWPVGMLGDSVFAYINPFAHFIAIIRDPMLGVQPPTVSYFVTSGIMLVFWALAIPTHCLTKDRVVFWL